MYRITVLCVGKLKEPHWREAQAEYLKRLKNYAKIDVIEVEAEPLGPTVTAAQSMEFEGKRLVKAIPQDSVAVALDVAAQTMTSEILAEKCQEWGRDGAHLVFIVGGAAGLAPEVREKVRARLSLSPLTFTHELARVILLEQVYRAMTILAGKTYHY